MIGHDGTHTHGSPVRDFDDVVCELQALEGHGLPLDPSARAVHQRLNTNSTHYA